MGRGSFRVLLGAVAALTGFAPSAHAADRYVDPVFDSVETQPDVPFGAAVNNYGQLQELLLDIYRPADDSEVLRPAVIYAHGGGFRNFTRQDVRSLPILEGYAKRGFVAMSIDYRLRPSGSPGAVSDPQLIIEALTGDSPTIRDAQEDMQRAVRWVRTNSASLGVDPDQIVVAGESAGAITAFEAAVNQEAGAEVGAAVSLWGAADPDHIEAGAPPVLEMHGASDTTVPLPLGTQACGLVIAWGGSCEQVIWPAERHAAFHRAPEILETSSNFICRYVIAGCQAPAPDASVTVSPG